MRTKKPVGYMRFNTKVEMVCSVRYGHGIRPHAHSEDWTGLSERAAAARVKKIVGRARVLMASDWLFMGFRESFSGLHFYLRVVSWAAQWSHECMLENPGS